MKRLVIIGLFILALISCGTAEKAGNDAAQTSDGGSTGGFKLDLERVDGGNFSFEEIRGKKHLVIAFWATWCDPCKAELKALAQIYPEFSDKVEFIGVSTDTEDLIDKVNEFAVSAALPFPVLIDPAGNVVSSLIPGSDSVPYMIVVSKDGEIVSKHSGYTPGDENRLGEELKKLIEK
ncbi:TlpA family protein disulfide reductase [bacterium]|nr:TlpA family protein disulfide reductase [bacterium]